MTRLATTSLTSVGHEADRTQRRESLRRAYAIRHSQGGSWSADEVARTVTQDCRIRAYLPDTQSLSMSNPYEVTDAQTVHAHRPANVAALPPMGHVVSIAGVLQPVDLAVLRFGINDCALFAIELVADHHVREAVAGDIGIIHPDGILHLIGEEEPAPVGVAVAVDLTFHRI
jgi:hypothetical protein